MLASLLVLVVASAAPDSSAALAHAVELFNNLQSDQAGAEFHKLLHRHPKTSDAARAHLYLGILAFNALDIDAARDEFRQALLLNPAIELPFNSSPKVMVTLTQVRNSLGQEGASAPSAPSGEAAAQPDATGPPSILLVPAPLVVPEAVQTATAPSRPVPASFWVTLGIGGAAAIAGVVLGVVSQGPAASAAAAPDVASGTKLLNQATTERIAADSCYGAAIVASVVAVVLLFTRGSAETPPPAVAATP
jgi:tetratricopeptide (TPR) repeat protein